LLAKAQDYTGVREKSALAREALKALIERESARRLARLGGCAPDLMPIPRREAPVCGRATDGSSERRSVWVWRLRLRAERIAPSCRAFFSQSAGFSSIAVHFWPDLHAAEFVVFRPAEFVVMVNKIR
jgi:hypothetical protein